jgi:uncharacterized membrane protein YdjX (TVP38/TMEM64 family)
MAKRENKKIPMKFVACPACAMIRHGLYEGRVTIEHAPDRFRRELENLIKAYCKRAFDRDPLDRLIAIRTKNDVMVLFFISSSIEKNFYAIAAFFGEYANRYPVASVVIFIGLAALSVIFASFSSVWLVPVAIFMWGDGYTLVVLLTGWYIGAMCSYGIGRYAGYPIVSSFVRPETFDHYRTLLFDGPDAFGLILISRFVLPSEFPGYILGAARYHFGKYFLATVLSEIPYALITVYAIDAVLKKDITLLFFGALFWLLFASLMLYLFYKKFNKKRVEKIIQAASSTISS